MSVTAVDNCTCSEPDSRRAWQAHHRAGWWLTGPALVLMFVILIAPVAMAAVLSLTSYSLGAADVQWVGLDNYEKLFTRSTYAKMFTATFTYVLVVVPVSVFLGLGAALLINSVGRFADVYKTIYFLPVMATLIAMAIVWQFMLHPSVGVINKTLAAGCGIPMVHGLFSLAAFGIDPETTWYGSICANGMPNWLGDRKYAIWVRVLRRHLAGIRLQHGALSCGSDRCIRENSMALPKWMARAVPGSRFWLVTWPALGPTTVFVVTITCIRAFQVFDTIEAFYPIGAAVPEQSAYVMMFAIFEKGVQQNLVGIGAAITMLFLLFVMAITLVQRWLVERKVHYA
jgi:multiple sugar transport system permease protein